MENFSFRLYAEGCARYIAQPDALAAFLQGRFLVPAEPGVAARLLSGMAGNVWVMRDYAGIAVISRLDGKHCSVRVEQGDSEVLRGYFLRLVEGSGVGEKRTEKIVDREIAGPAGPVQYVAYRTPVPSPHAQDIYILSSMTTGSGPGGARITVLASALAKGDLPLQ